MPAESATAIPRPPARTATAPVLTGAQAVVRSLELLGVTDVFGLPGRRDPAGLRRAAWISSELRHVLVRHEQGATRHGRRPSATRAASRQGRRRDRDLRPRCDQPRRPRIADAYMDSDADGLHHRPGASRTLDGDRTRSRRPTSSASRCRSRSTSFLVTSAPATRSRAATAARRFAIAGLRAAPGPVLIDITKDAQQKAVPFVWTGKVRPPGLPSGDRKARTASRSRPRHSCSSRPRAPGVLRRWRRRARARLEGTARAR